METSDCIIEGLYLGGIMAALNEQDLQGKGITHVLSVDEKPLPDVLTSQINYKHVFALDLYDFDLLSCFPECLAFIDQARESGGKVLVHCQAGISRSSTIVIAYLMHKLNLSKQQAVDHVTAVRNIIKPNDGFQEQLQLFENMGTTLDKKHGEFRAYQLNKLAVKFQCGQFSGGVPESEIPAEVYVEPDYSAKEKAAFFKCRKCRLFLFHSGAVTSHNIGEGESAFDWRSKVPANQRRKEDIMHGDLASSEFPKVPKCGRSLFVDPLVWMKGKIHEVQGKLHCPKCDTKIGSYVWYGEKCPCGAWVAPAFHVDNGKVDKIPSQPVVPSPYNPASTQGASSSASNTPGGLTSPGRPLSYVPLPERSSSATSARNLVTPVAAVQPRVAMAVSPTVRDDRQAEGQPHSIFPASPTQAASESLLNSTQGQRLGVQRAAAAVAPLHSMELDDTEGAGSRGDNMDLESGISSIHMDVDS